MDQERIVAIIMVPANLLAGRELVRKTCHLLQEEYPNHAVVAEALDDISVSVPDGFMGFQFVIEAHVRSTGFLTITDEG